MNRSFLVFLFLICPLFSTASEFSQAQADLQQMPVVVSPPNTDQPTMVNVGLYLREVTQLDEGSNSFTIEGYLDLKWEDRRLAFDQSESGFGKKVFLEENAHSELAQIWWPDIQFVNAIGASQIENEELIIYADGVVEYQERFRVTLATNFKMRRFPFDTQTLKIEIESFAWSSEFLIFQVIEDIVGISDEFNIPGWKVINIEAHIESKQEPRDRAPFSEFVTGIQVERDPGFFVTKLIFPLTLIIILISSTLWIAPSEFAGRISGTLVGLLTSAAFGIQMARFLPAHVHGTYLDALILCSFVFAALLVSIHTASRHYFVTDRGDFSLRIDTVSRWLFPLLYLTTIFGLAWIYLA
ncbi:MAG: hypothetical protein QGE95_12730 [Arenicellales bacterium]|jgi:hypothetical protein|nr:hypothetical protein [Arenicellales bacterium]|tara:strand:- start:213 stop:1277 length:1065 start_codon:yes stop_codon:yes gene_type:complete